MRVGLACAAVSFMLLCIAYPVAAQIVDESCKPVQNCTPARDCTVGLTTFNKRECRKCLVTGIFGNKCVVYGNDPLCEAQNAAQNAEMASRLSSEKLVCESLKAREKLACEATVSNSVAECEARKDSTKGPDGTDKFQKLLLLDVPQLSLPAAVSTVLVAYNIYQNEYLKTLSVSQLPNWDAVPDPFRETQAVTVGTRIFIKTGTDPEKLPLRDWIGQIEMAKLFANYGFASTVEALNKDAATIIRLVDSKVTSVCLELNCQGP